MPTTISNNQLRIASTVRIRIHHEVRREYSVSTSKSAPELAREHVTDLASDAGDRASAVSEHARAAGSETVATAGRGVTKVKDETVSQARDLVGQARDQVTAQANTQLGQLGSTMRRLAAELEEMGNHSDHDGMARSVVTEAAQRTHRLADMVEGREITELLEDVRDFARRRPGVFLAGAAAFGVLVGRIGRGVVDSGASRSEPTRSAEPITNAEPTEYGADR